MNTKFNREEIESQQLEAIYCACDEGKINYKSSSLSMHILSFLCYAIAYDLFARYLGDFLLAIVHQDSFTFESKKVITGNLPFSPAGLLCFRQQYARILIHTLIIDYILTWTLGKNNSSKKRFRMGLGRRMCACAAKIHRALFK